MPRETRRTFLGKASTLSAGAAVMSFSRDGNAAGANERIVYGIIGCGARGAGFCDGAAYVCDPDQGRLAGAARRAKVDEAHAVTDLRRIVDDKTVDAVIISTPDHWHAPAAILACDAGKHVYIEKPCSHNVREGRLLLDAARRNKVVVQHGTQSRSSSLIAGAVQMLREGIIGDVLMAKAWNVQRRTNIGRAEPSDPPSNVDYDMWVGPAEWMPFQKNRFHYDWHWWYNFGGGGSGTDGPHEIDYARWGLGVDTHPSRVVSLGGKFYFDDDRDHCDTQWAICEYPGDGTVGSARQLVYEQRLWSTNYPYNVDSGAEYYGTKGKMFVSKRGKLEILGERNARIEKTQPDNPPQLVGNHVEDFFDAIRTGRRPNADIEDGHLSATIGHLANIATRVGRALDFDPQTETIAGDEEAAALLGRKYREGGHWAIPDGA